MNGDTDEEDGGGNTRHRDGDEAGYFEYNYDNFLQTSMSEQQLNNAIVEQERPTTSSTLPPQRGQLDDVMSPPTSENPPTFFEVEAELVQDLENPPVYNAVAVAVDNSSARPSFWQRYQPAIVVLIVFLGITLVTSFRPWENEDATTTNTLLTMETPTMKSTFEGNTTFSEVSTNTSAEMVSTVPPKRNVPFSSITTSTSPSVGISSTTATIVSTPVATPTRSTTMAVANTPTATTIMAATKAPRTNTTLTTNLESPTASTSTVPCTEFRATLIEHTDNAVDCKEECANVVAMDGDSAIVTRDKIDIQILSHTSGSFEEVTTIPFRHTVDAAAISGNVAAVGYMKERYDGKNTGGVYAYERDSAGDWIRTAHIDPSALDIGRAGDKFEIAVDVDESRLIIGVPENGKSGNRGSVYIYKRDGRTWLEEEKLIPDNIDKNVEWFGTSVSIKGQILAVGDLLYGNDDEGAIFIYDASSNSWGKTSVITNPDCNRWFGADLKLTHDGGLLAGCPGADDRAGAVYYYTKPVSTGEYEMEQKITASTGDPGDAMGARVAVGSDIILAGTLRKETGGKVHAFKKTNRDFWKEALTIDGPASSVNFGTNFGVSFDAQKSKGFIIVGSDGNVHYYALACS